MLTLIRAGLYTSVQDAGRFGMRQSGVSYCGALDRPALDRTERAPQTRPKQSGGRPVALRRNILTLPLLAALPLPAVRTAFAQAAAVMRLSHQYPPSHHIAGVLAPNTGGR